MQPIGRYYKLTSGAHALHSGQNATAVQSRPFSAMLFVPLTILHQKLLFSYSISVQSLPTTVHSLSIPA